ncbi:MAG: SH3 domain-containing protein [Pyrinomonadaceae bacterium]|nr:SH3 domain-containing protein [Acidobacteriota bacterium]MBK7933766.1 SH3 domain-containing protein [Acidobacteriota bacterium]MBP7375718.1 SH3 domain-containing protein [Pyrinomonadaceae bacterium]
MRRNTISSLLPLGILLAVGLACNGLPTIQTQQSAPPPAATPAPQATAAPQATPDQDNAILLQKLAELEKKIDDQKKAGKTVAPPVINSRGTTAWVNSPGDGFLALRSDPNSNIGYRILQIPHGANVRVLSCQGYSQNIGGRTGRWCRVSYGGTTGWAFDGWLVY